MEQLDRIDPDDTGCLGTHLVKRSDCRSDEEGSIPFRGAEGAAR
jgi:hypothetical protein